MHVLSNPVFRNSQTYHIWNISLTHCMHWFWFDDDDEMSVSLVDETGVPGGNHRFIRQGHDETFTPKAHAQSQDRTRVAAM